MNASQVLGMGEEWKGGDIANSPGGAFKINLLRKEMENHKDDDELIVLFSDSYDVVAVGRYGSFKGFRMFSGVFCITTFNMGVI